MPESMSTRPSASRAARALGLLLIGTTAGVAATARGDEARDRRPVALALSGDGAWLYAANARGGSLSVVSLATGKVTAEIEVGRGLSGLAILPDGRRLLAVDRAGDALIALEIRGGGEVAIGARVAVAADPVSVLVAPDGMSCVVASTRARRLTVVSIPADPGVVPTIARVVDLPFSPRNLAWARPGSALVVADAFGGRIAVVDPSKGVVESVRTLPGHNIRGLALAPDGRTLVVAHQSLNPLADSSFEDVHWGTLLRNHLRVLRVDALLDPRPAADIYRGGRVIDLGMTGTAAGDPGAIGFDGQGRLAVVLGGVDEVALGPEHGRGLRRVGVGHKPSAVLASPDGKRVYAADELDDAISVLDVEAGKRVATIGLGQRPEPGPVARGERLFFDARLSHDGWMSCQSCHTDGQSNGLLADTLGDGAYGAPKRVTSLLDVGATGPWTWLGTVDRLEDQVRKSIETTMRGRPPTDGQVADLTAYLRSLKSPPPESPADPDGAASRGREVFASRDCARCHAGPEFTSAGRHDVGLVDEAGNRKFNPPSLRGAGRRRPLLHDGRAASLEDLFQIHRHPRHAEWAPGELADLIAYLKTL